VKWVLGLADPVNEVDREISRRVAAWPPSPVDTVMKGLSTAANHSLLWFVVAAGLSVRRGATRKAAGRGVLAISLASTAANAVCKPLLPRRRPAAAELPAYQKLPSPPTSSSFPSGHSASAVAFATAVGLESPRVGLALAPVAAAVSYSRMHVGVHWFSDVAAGALLGAGMATLTRRWWPVRETDEARARPVGSVPALPDGEGVLMMVNQRSGHPDYDPLADVVAALPRAEILTVQQGHTIEQQLEAALARRSDEVGGQVKALGITGGDGSVGAAAAVAHRHGLPLVVVPLGTLNHFARDIGVYDLLEVGDATRAGEAVAVGLGTVEVHPVDPPGSDRSAPDQASQPDDDAVVRARTFVNTASIGSYPELVRLRERWQPRYGKWPAFVAALLVVLRRAKPVRVRFLGRWRTVWFLFVGNGPYHPRGMVPAWRPTLDSGLLDVRWLRADVRFSRLRVGAALILGALGHSRVYEQCEVPELDVELAVPGMLATDGEVVETSGRYTFRVADGAVPVYRRDERHWQGRPRPFVG
jgi:diacylglycerol kinase family enzyme/membrane-associated phospholipid phosphatase